jgi:lysosome membrane protein 2
LNGEKETRLIPGSAVLEQWGNVTIPIYVRFYVFDVQNPDNVELDGARPKLVERGPYTFLQKRSKRISEYLDNDRIVKYHEFKYFHFDAKRSVGSLDDLITVPNIPLMVMAHRATTDQSEDAGIMFDVLESLLKRLEPPMFENHTIGEMLFQGFHVELFEELTKMLQAFSMPVPDKLAEARFGLLYKVRLLLSI